MAVIDYIYTKESCRNVAIAFGLIKNLLNELISRGIKSAERENKNGKYEDQILLIKDIRKTANLSMRDLMTKPLNYLKEENASM